MRAYILWELRRFKGRQDLNGGWIDGVDLLARSHTTAYQHVVLGEPSSPHPANRLILPTDPGVSIRRALLNLGHGNSPLFEEILISHGVQWEALRELAQEDGEGFIRARADFLAAEERSFIIEMGIEPATEAIGEADIDTE